jgi:hypothetical protein
LEKVPVQLVTWLNGTSRNQKIKNVNKRKCKTDMNDSLIDALTNPTGISKKNNNITSTLISQYLPNARQKMNDLLATKPVRKKKKNPPDFFFRIQQVMYYK